MTVHSFACTLAGAMLLALSCHGADPATCPVIGHAATATRTTSAGGLTNGDWWPDQVNLAILHQNPPAGGWGGSD